MASSIPSIFTQASELAFIQTRPLNHQEQCHIHKNIHSIFLFYNQPNSMLDPGQQDTPSGQALQGSHAVFPQSQSS